MVGGYEGCLYVVFEVYCFVVGDWCGVDVGVIVQCYDCQCWWCCQCLFVFVVCMVGMVVGDQCDIDWM